jgi:transcription initiation factor TFIID subunit 1, fungi type
MTSREENEAVSALTGLSLDNLLDGFSFSRSGLSNQLGISGIPSLDSSQIYNDKYDDDDAIGADEGEDFEDEVDRELRNEGSRDVDMKAETRPVKQKKKRVRVVKRLVERPKSVYERFPAFEKNKILDFSELFKGYTVQKPRVAKRMFQSASPNCCGRIHADCL